MSEYTKFDEEIYSEDLQPVTEQEFDEVQAMIAAESDGWQGYEDFSRELESENFVVRKDKVYHKPEPKPLGRIGGYEL